MKENNNLWDSFCTLVVKIIVFVVGVQCAISLVLWSVDTHAYGHSSVKGFKMNSYAVHYHHGRK